MPTKKIDPCWVSPLFKDKYYVYVLYDNKMLPFYIGKGKGYRINNHVKPSLLKTPSHKVNKILKLIKDYGYVKREIVSYHDTEEAAYNIEEFLISMYGIVSEGGLLTNACKSRFDIPEHVKTSASAARKQRPRRFSEQLIKEQHTLWKHGQTTIQKASVVVGCSSGYLAAVFNGRKLQHLKLNGAPEKLYKVHTREAIEYVLYLRASGSSYTEIVKSTGIPKTSIARIITQNG